ncbi:ETC complex I subunit [Ferruginivarius sediminum]|uniref:ETC complex I subunit n=1 Tax=Ferruginivarius sediminum TaxID=2661937 RepID=A0A369TEY9_9PROT|nr:ETC complex I subunit [Ferruginivarius sediminum]RDD63883.1 ETC complex I subunit [Ferruginivarius sediminum]
MQARIYQMPKTAMQSGRANTGRWVLEFEAANKREVEPLMGWTSSSDTQTQVRIWFDSKEDAIRHCEREGYMYTVEDPRTRNVRPKSYADNFKYKRLGIWTH